MTITTTHPETTTYPEAITAQANPGNHRQDINSPSADHRSGPGRSAAKNRLLGAVGVVVAVLMTVGLAVLSSGSDSGSTAAAPATNADQTVVDHLVSINEIPWAPAAVPEAGKSLVLDAGRDHRFFLSINDVDPVAPVAGRGEADHRFFLSINDVEQ